jgi:hypothetical protein
VGEVTFFPSDESLIGPPGSQCPHEEVQNEQQWIRGNMVVSVHCKSKILNSNHLQVQNCLGKFEAMLKKKPNDGEQVNE